MVNVNTKSTKKNLNACFVILLFTDMCLIISKFTYGWNKTLISDHLYRSQHSAGTRKRDI